MTQQGYIRFLIKGIRANTGIDITKEVKGYHPQLDDCKAIYHYFMDKEYPKSYSDADKRKHLEHFENHITRATFKRRFELVSNFIRLNG